MFEQIKQAFGIGVDPNAMNETYGVPESVVRQARGNQMAQLGANIYAMSQQLTPSQRAQVAQNMASQGNDFQKNIYNAAQSRLIQQRIELANQKDAREREALSMLQKQLQAAPDSPQRRQALAYLGMGDATNAIKAYYDVTKPSATAEKVQMLLQANPGMSEADAINQVVKSSGTNITLNTAKPWSEQAQKNYQETIEAGQQAGALNSELNTFEALMTEGAQTGWAEPWKMRVKQVTGIDLGTVAGQEALQSVSNRIVAPLVKQLGQNPTDRDLQFIVDSIPRLSATEGGNRLMIEALRISNQRKIATADFVRQYMRENVEAFKTDPFVAQLNLDQAMQDFAASRPEVFADSTARLRAMFQNVAGGVRGDNQSRVRRLPSGVTYELPEAN